MKKRITGNFKFQINFFITILLLFSASVTIAQNAGDIDLSFNNPVYALGDSTRFNNYLTYAVQQPDGKLIVGGSFTSYIGNNYNRIIRLDLNDNPDTTFTIGNGFDITVSCIVVQSDNKIIAAGQFQSYNGDSCGGILRLNPDGSRVTSFHSYLGFPARYTDIDFSHFILA